MKRLFVVREYINYILQEYEKWFLIIAKFIGMMFVFTYINGSLGYFGALDNTMVNVLLSLICSIISGGLTVFIVGAVIVAHMLKLSVVLTGLVLVVMAIAYLMFLKFAPNQSVVLLAVPVLMQYNMHYLVPILAGMFFTPYAVVPAVIGMIMVKFIGYSCEAVVYTGTGMSIDFDGIQEALESIISHMAAEKEIYFFAAVVAATLVVMFVIGLCSFDYAWYVAIGAGAVVEVCVAMIGSMKIKTGTNLVQILGAVLISGVIAVIIQFMKCTVDYASKESVQFEDEKYYYYVKAIPKIVMTDLALKGASRERTNEWDHEEKVKKQKKKSASKNIVKDDNSKKHKKE